MGLEDITADARALLQPGVIVVDYRRQPQDAPSVFAVVPSKFAPYERQGREGQTYDGVVVDADSGLFVPAEEAHGLIEGPRGQRPNYLLVKFRLAAKPGGEGVSRLAPAPNAIYSLGGGSVRPKDLWFENPLLFGTRSFQGLFTGWIDDAVGISWFGSAQRIGPQTVIPENVYDLFDTMLEKRRTRIEK